LKEREQSEWIRLAKERNESAFTGLSSQEEQIKMARKIIPESIFTDPNQLGVMLRRKISPGEGHIFNNSRDEMGNPILPDRKKDD
ncbi:MAG: hypothetical protein CUN54_10980, partial [Phototrophicales bacterium]